MASFKSYIFHDNCLLLVHRNAVTFVYWTYIRLFCYTLLIILIICLWIFFILCGQSCYLNVMTALLLLFHHFAWMPFSGISSEVSPLCFLSPCTSLGHDTGSTVLLSDHSSTSFTSLRILWGNRSIGFWIHGTQ